MKLSDYFSIECKNCPDGGYVCVDHRFTQECREDDYLYIECLSCAQSFSGTEGTKGQPQQEGEG